MADLSLSKQCDIILKAEQVWADSQNQTEQYTADADTVKALAEKQKDRTRFLTSIEDPNLDDDEVKVVWIDTCGTGIDEVTQDVCDFSGGDAPLNSETYVLDQTKSATFSIDENDLRRNQYSIEEYAAKQLLAKTKALDEHINAQSLLFLSANAGWNKNPETYNFNATTLEIPTADYNVDLLVKMAKDAKINKLMDPFVVDSGNLFTPFLKAELEAGNGEGKGAFRKRNLFNTSFDLVGFPTAPVTDTTFLISPSSYAFASRTYNPDTPTTVTPTDGWQQRYTIPSNNVPGLKYDVYYKYECVGKRFKHTWSIHANWGFFLNPKGCDVLISTGPDVFDNVTGILSYTKVA